MKSSAHNYLAKSEEGTFQFTEYALNYSRQLNQVFRAGVQVGGVDLGDIGENRLGLDWGFLEYRPLDNLGIRIGKMFTPA